MFEYFRIWFFSFFLLAFFAFTPSSVRAQCAGVPSVTSLGSNKIPQGLCAPVQASVTYSVAFASAVPAGKLELVYDWGDGTSPEVIPLATGLKAYNASRNHTFPSESDCEYYVTMVLRYNEQTCTSTTQVQRISSWRTDNVNGGNVSLVSPVSGTNTHLVCEGENIDVVFNDETNWNCNANYLKNGADLIESPNIEYRWQQIVYNTATSGNKIPNVYVNGVQVTGVSGTNVLTSYQDPRGTYFMSAPVVTNDNRRRPSLKITANGGFGTGLPKAGDTFEMTLRYWNFCNPYDDPEIPGPPTDPINGDHPPVEKKAFIRITAPPSALTATDQAVCLGTAPSAFSVTGVGSGNIVKWYRYVPGSEFPGDLITSGKSASLPVTSHPEWKNNNTPGVYKVWASQQTNTSGKNCESPPILITRTVREDLVVADPVSNIPQEICNGQSFTVTFPEPATEVAGGRTSYTFTGSAGVTLTSSTTNSATFTVNIPDFQNSLYVDKTFTVKRQYATLPICVKSKVFNIRVMRSPLGGTVSGKPQVCEADSIGKLVLAGYVGKIKQWEWKKGDGAYSVYNNESVESITAGLLDPGVYSFRALVTNGTCNEVYSKEHKLEVFESPAIANAGKDQYICSALSSAELSGSSPLPGKGKWTYVSSVPAGLPSPSFTPEDPNTTVVITSAYAGAYMMRWTVTNGACTSSDDVLIDFGTNPTDPDAGRDQVVCGPTAVLGGNIPEKGLGSWTVVSGPNCAGNDCPISFSSANSPTSEIRLNNPSGYGSYKLRWSISSGGNNCFLKSDDVIVAFQQAVKAEASDIKGICMDADNLASILLTGVAEGSVKSVEWLNVTGKGSISGLSTTQEKTSRRVIAYYHPSIDDYKIGKPIQVMLRVTSANSACSETEKIITIHFDRKPAAIAGEDLRACSQEVKLQAVAPLYDATGMWYSDKTEITFSNRKDPNAIVSNLPIGTSSLKWIVASKEGTCAPDTATVTITRLDLPAVKNITITGCEEQAGTTNVLLSAYEDSITSVAKAYREITWLRHHDSKVMDGAVLQQNIPDGTVYIATVRDVRTGCTDNAQATIKVRSLPRVQNVVISECEDIAGTNIVSGIDLTSQNKAITKESNVTVSWHYSEKDAAAKLLPIKDLLMVNGQQQFFARITFNDSPSCYSVARLNVVVDQQPMVNAIFGKESVCEGDESSGNMPVEVYQVFPVAGAKYLWEIDKRFKLVSGGGEDDFYALLQFPDAGTGKIRVKAELKGCSGPVVEKTINVSPSPAQPVIQGRSIVCKNENLVSFSVSPNNFPASVYYWEIRRTTDHTPLNSYIVEGQSTGNILVNFKDEDVTVTVRESNATCVSPVAVKPVTILEPPKVDLKIEKNISCFLGNDGVLKTLVSGGSNAIESFELVQTGQKDKDNDGVFTGLRDGVYSVRVTDANGCVVVTDTRHLQHPKQVVIDKIDILTDDEGYNVSCPGAKDGEMKVFFSGGIDSAEYVVTLTQAGNAGVLKELTGKDSVVFTGIGAGTYSVVVQDRNDCHSLPVTASLVEPQDLYAGIVGSDQVLCSGEKPMPIDEVVPVQGGHKTVSYEWQTSASGDPKDDLAWTTLPGKTASTLTPSSFTTEKQEHRYFRRIVRSVSHFKGQPQFCSPKGKTEKVTLTINPLPEAVFTSSADQICDGDAVALSLKLTTGYAPVSFDYKTSSETRFHQSGSAETSFTIAGLTKDETFTLLRLTDANGCTAPVLPPPVNVSVVTVNPDFSVASPEMQCDRSQFLFRWNAAKGISYRWEWGDGTSTEILPNELRTGENELSHTYQASSAAKATDYMVKLFASYEGCHERIASKTVRVAPSIGLNITASDTLLCSGEAVTFRNYSYGDIEGEWYYRQHASARTMKPDKIDGKTATFSFHNNTTENPVRYEVIYEARNNSGCKDVYRQNVYVFRANSPSFTVDSIPVFDNGEAVVHITNSSEVTDPSEFSFNWNFNGGSSANLSSGDQSQKVNYYSPGKKEISLTVVNNAAGKSGKQCNSTFRREIIIPVKALKASFKATPTAACSPATIQVENLSTGADAFLWKLYRAGTLVTTSNLANPQFTIAEPGVYRIALTASVTGSQQSEDVVGDNIEIFEVPHASFEARTNVVYVPDNPVELFNFSTGANQYEWHFGDGHISDDADPSHNYQHDAQYRITLIAKADHGEADRDGDGVAEQHLVCYDTAHLQVTALPGGEIKAPNAFTPDTNGPNSGRITEGGINDVFLPVGKGITEFQMQVYDRWGVIIFESNDREIGWNGYNAQGQLMPAGVYVYKLIIRLSDGEKITRIGDVTLIL